MERLQRKYRTLVEAAPDAIFLVDADEGTIVETNERAAELLGRPIGEILGTPVTDVHPDDKLPEYRERFEQTRGNGTIRFTDLPDGSQAHVVAGGDTTVPVEIHARRVSLDGEPFVYSIVRDVGDRLERERRLELQNERLQRFTDVASHDLRNPLNVANGRLQLAREECDSDHLDAVGRAHDRMEALIDDLLAIAREGEAAMEIEAVDLASVVEECWRTVATDATALVVDTDAVVRADRSRLRQLLENLIRNAVEHGTPTDPAEAADGGATVTVGDTADGDGFYVADDGPGIPAADRERVFELGHSTGEGGTGFGLAIVREVAESHGWEVRVGESDAGGARVEVAGVGIER